MTAVGRRGVRVGAFLSLSAASSSLCRCSSAQAQHARLGCSSCLHLGSLGLAPEVRMLFALSGASSQRAETSPASVCSFY